MDFSNPDTLLIAIASLTLLSVLVGVVILLRGRKGGQNNTQQEALGLQLDAAQKAHAQSLQMEQDRRREGEETLRSEIATLKQQTASQQKTITALEKKNTELKTAAQATDHNNARIIQELKADREQMALRFKEMATEAVETQAKKLTETSAATLEPRVKPVAQDLKSFTEAFEALKTETVKERESLKVQVQSLTSQTKLVSDQAESLTRALRGDQKKQGNWGEMVLANILDACGLVEGRDYDREKSFQGDDGRLRPDVIVKLPQQKNLVIDSKVNLVAFERYQNADTHEESAAALRDHSAAIQAHIKGLASKEYQSAVPGTLDFVILFMANEAAFAAASAHDPTLTAFAAERNIAIATPSTLLMALRTVSNIWMTEKRNRNAEEIASRAGVLYDKVHGFVHSFEQIGKQLGTVENTYQKAMRQLTAGPGNLLRQTEMLKGLGAKASKQLDEKYVDRVEDSDSGNTDTPPLLTGLDAADEN